MRSGRSECRLHLLVGRFLAHLQHPVAAGLQRGAQFLVGSEGRLRGRFDVFADAR